MKNTSTNKSISGKYYWWAQSAPVEVLTRKFRNQSPKINDSFHMLSIGGQTLTGCFLEIYILARLFPQPA